MKTGEVLCLIPEENKKNISIRGIISPSRLTAVYTNCYLIKVIFE